MSELAPSIGSRPSPIAKDKIQLLENLARETQRWQQEGKQVVLCHGVFDILHPGHIRHLEAAKREGDVLVVTVTPDEYVNKGPGRPYFNHGLRAQSLAALECVDGVGINRWPTAVETIALLRPDVYVKGSEYAVPEQDVTGKIVDEKKAVETVGGRIHFTGEITFSSSHLLNRNSEFQVFPPEVEAWLHAFREKYSADDVIGFLKKTETLKVLVLGEAIIDEYVFCDALGRSTKDPILASRYRGTEAYAGGALAVANHVAGFCKEVSVVTCLGDTERQETLIREKLSPKIRPHFVTRHLAPTIHKRRFVDQYSGVRMFELYLMEDQSLAGGDEQSLLNVLEKTVDQFDVVVVADYGHGMLTERSIRTLCERSRFLCVMTQANAGNRGFNTISKYPRADYICLALYEIALEARMRHANWRDLVLNVVKRIDCPRFTVTQGSKGTLHYQVGSDFTEVPALATKVVDRVGAGDAVFAVTSLLMASGAPCDVTGFAGNLAGAEMVGVLGNSLSIDRNLLGKHITALLK
jgi:rfaE bifunctional protein kinase chain/domain/rfaE bifunctional protein nucleotidyltransferase chain/domain